MPLLHSPAGQISLLLIFLVSPALSAPGHSLILQFSPPRLQDVTLIEGGAAESQHKVLLTNTGDAVIACKLQAQCDANLSPHQAQWMSLDQRNITLAPLQSIVLQVKLTAAALLQGTYQSQICVYTPSEHADSSGLNPPTVAQLPVSVTVLCARFAPSAANNSACSINLTQTAVLAREGKAPELFFEAELSFNEHSWPALNTSAALQHSVVVNNGAGSVYNATLSPPNNQCGTYTLRGTTPLSSTSDRTEASSLNITVLAAANATATSGNCAVQTQIDSSNLPSIAAPPVEASGAVNKWSPTVRPFSLQPVYLVQGSTNRSAEAKLTLSNPHSQEHSVQIVTDCYNSTSAGSTVPWLQLSQRDITLAANASQDITLMYDSDAMTAGTYRAQLCLFADYNYGDVAAVVQVQLLVLCPRYEGYVTAPTGCNITFSNITDRTAAVAPSYDGSAAAQLNPAAAAPSPQVLSPANVAATTADGDTAFQAVVAFNRPVVGSQSLQSLAGMLRSSGLEDGRITTVTENLSQGANCGLYNVAGVVSGSTNISLTVVGLYDISNMVNKCVGQAM